MSKPPSEFRHEPYWKQYQFQGFNASARGIEFKLTYPQWIAIWTASGHLEQRGRKSAEYCMSRYGDKGAYEVGNVQIITNRENSSNNFGRKKQSLDERQRRSETQKLVWKNRSQKERKRIGAKQKATKSKSARFTSVTTVVKTKKGSEIED